ncbi:hypothetical protein BASA81_003487 [Batrachochytrium salamandrivorans]|nr:hypothetical protein BASA81_003487 [Batrachochytrium salamandrivorans]
MTSISTKKTTTASTVGKKASANSKGDGVTKRLQTELMGLMTSGDKAATAFPDGDNLFKWVGTLKGGDDTVFEGLVYKLELRFRPNTHFPHPRLRLRRHAFIPMWMIGGTFAWTF